MAELADATDLKDLYKIEPFKGNFKSERSQIQEKYKN